MDMMIKTVKRVELNTKFVSVVLNIQTLKIKKIVLQQKLPKNFY